MNEKKTALESITYAQQLAFAPIAFQATLALRDFGILSHIESSGEKGIDMDSIVKTSGLSVYGTRVLLEAGLGVGLLELRDGKYTITNTGFYINNDAMTRANMDFVQDVCYRGMYWLKDSIKDGAPLGLKTLGDWPTVYEGLSKLKPQEQKSWFAFDHFYSSDSFPAVLPLVFKEKPLRVLDIGGNTGKWAIQCAKFDENVTITICDLPGQLNMAAENIKSLGLSDRVGFYEINLLDENSKLPQGYDVIWMSQFLDCFSEEQIVSILKRCHEALEENACVFILEPFWDRQRFPVSAFCLQMTSLYFTNIANGNSQMYHSSLFSDLVRKAGFDVAQLNDNIGVSHTLMK
ncbi:MAG: methyltransferase, partial [Bacteroidota bacterium]